MRHQPAFPLHLALRQFISLVGERVFAGAEFHANGCAGKVEFAIPEPQMFDSSGIKDVQEPAETAVSTSLAADGDGWTITLSPDRSWLADPARVFPVHVDPTSSVAWSLGGYSAVVATRLTRASTGSAVQSVVTAASSPRQVPAAWAGDSHVTSRAAPEGRMVMTVAPGASCEPAATTETTVPSTGAVRTVWLTRA